MKTKFVSTIVVSMALALFISVSSASAWSLLSPLSGDINNRTVTSSFGDNWIESCGGYTKKHAGLDVYASVGEPVYAADDGLVRIAQTHAQWVGYVAIDHSFAKTYPLTTVYWHISPIVSANTYVTKGTLLGYVGYLSTGTHFHFGVREGWYSYISYAGSLPQTNCGGYPAFPELFIDPESINYEYNNN